MSAHLFAALCNWSVPPPEQRTAWTLSSTPLLAIPLLLLIGAATIRLYKEDGWKVWRFAYALLALPITWHILLGHYTYFPWISSDGIATSLLHFDFVEGVTTSIWSLIMVELLFLGSPQDFDVLGAELYYQWSNEDRPAKRSGQFGSSRSLTSLKRPTFFPGTWNPLPIDIVSSVRGFGYGRGPPGSKCGYRALMEAEKLAQRPAHEAQTMKRQLMWKALKTTLWSYFLLDVSESIIQEPRIFPTATRHGPSSLSAAREGVFGACGPWLLTVTVCFMAFHAMQSMSTFFYLLSLILTRPSQIPITQARFEPFLFGEPHKSTSVREMWGKHWHSLLRRFFVLYGYRPVQSVARFLGASVALERALSVLGAFTVSGLVHEMCLEAILPHFAHWDRVKSIPFSLRGEPLRMAHKRGFGASNWASTRFFVMQGIAIVLEEWCTKTLEPGVCALLGRKSIVPQHLRPHLGWLWTMTFMAYTGYSLVDVRIIMRLFSIR